MILGIDPGSEKSAYVLWDGERVRDRNILRNESILDLAAVAKSEKCAIGIEMISSYGMPVGKEVFETCVWIGRFIQAMGEASMIYRHEIKSHFCNSQRAKDGNIRQALIDRFGGKERAIGKKKSPGPLYGIKGDEWAALAVALFLGDRIQGGRSSLW
ncbi:MAG: hypothetical protein ABSF48_10340 [Thermodesulfobacteriota bacterium]|jgi:hypothetical protein